MPLFHCVLFAVDYPSPRTRPPPFQFNALSGKLARCPRCRTVSSVGSYARRRGGVFLAAGLIVLAIALGVTFGTFEFAKSTHGVYVVYVGKAGTGGMGLVRQTASLR